MSWSVGYDHDWKRDIGYAVTAFCDHPDCSEVIDRGLANVCCEQQPYGGENGCGLYFCDKHRSGSGKCSQCAEFNEVFEMKADHPDWIAWKLVHESWEKWRSENMKWMATHDTPEARARGMVLVKEDG